MELPSMTMSFMEVPPASGRDPDILIHVTVYQLSPAAASYHLYKNFEERGDAFARLALGGSKK